MNSDTKTLRRFTMMTYGCFIILLLITGVVITFVTKNQLVKDVLVAICSWSSFFVLMIGFRRYCPNKTRKAFIKELFAEKLNWKLCITLIAVAFFVYVVSLCGSAWFLGKSITECIPEITTALIPTFFIKLIQGPTGEEAGWRGYFVTALNKRRPLISSSLITGLLWAFWHSPLWFMENLSIRELIIYILSFVIAIVSINIVMCLVFSRHRNIIYCIILHQLENFLVGSMILAPMTLVMVWNAIIYAVLAVFTIIIYRKNSAPETT